MSRSIILLRGLARGSGHWGGFVSHITHVFPDDLVVPIDLAGNGERFNEVSPETIDHAILDIHQEILKRDLKPPYYVIGLSLGGMIAISAMQSSEIEIEKTVAINVSYSGVNMFYDRLRLSSMVKLFSATLLPVTLRESLIYHLTSNNHGHNQRKDTLKLWSYLNTRYPVNVKNVWNQMRIAMSFKRPIKLSPDKCLLLASTKDKLVNPKCSDQIAKRFGLSLFFHPRAGHDIAHDDPAWVSEKCIDFFNAIEE